jgi:superfamily I DNA/RNA helicase
LARAIAAIWIPPIVLTAALAKSPTVYPAKPASAGQTAEQPDAGDKKAVTLLAESQLDLLLDKLSGYAKAEERILVLARYHHLKPAAWKKATRWPKLQLDFMTIHASKGQQADYVIVVGLHDGNDGFRLRRASRLWRGATAGAGRFSGC